MSKSTLIKNGRIIDPSNGIDEIADLAIYKGKIDGIGSNINEKFEAKHVIDAKGQWVLPGIVDLSAYLREPGQENKTRILFETYSAVSQCRYYSNLLHARNQFTD